MPRRTDEARIRFRRMRALLVTHDARFANAEQDASNSRKARSAITWQGSAFAERIDQLQEFRAVAVGLDLAHARHIEQFLFVLRHQPAHIVQRMV